MRFFVWLVRGFIFFTLFAFALNNQQKVTVRWFFGVDWQAPMVIVVLAAFIAGCVIGVISMVPGWWRQRRVEQRRGASAAPVPTASAPVPLAPAAAAAAVAGTASDFGPEHPPRDGL